VIITTLFLRAISRTINIDIYIKINFCNFVITFELDKKTLKNLIYARKKDVKCAIMPLKMSFNLCYHVNAFLVFIEQQHFSIIESITRCASACTEVFVQ